MATCSRRSALGLAALALGALVPGTASAEGRNSQLQFEIFRDSRGRFRWRLKSANGQIVATSGDYKAKASCRASIELIQRDAAAATIEDLG